MAAACQIFISLFLYAFACVTAATLPTATVNSTTPELAKVRPVEYQNSSHSTDRLSPAPNLASGRCRGFLVRSYSIQGLRQR